MSVVGKIRGLRGARSWQRTEVTGDLNHGACRGPGSFILELRDQGGCQVDQDAIPMLEIVEAYRTAVLAKDVDTFVRLYDEDVCVFDMWGQWSYRGVEAWRGMVTGWFGSLGDESVAVSFEDVQASLNGDFALLHAKVTYKNISTDGRELHAMPNRLTWALRRVAGGWKIVHEHTSAPVDFETLKVIPQI